MTLERCASHEHPSGPRPSEILRSEVAAGGQAEHERMICLAAAALVAAQFAPAGISAERLFALNRQAIGAASRGIYRSVEETQSDRGDVWRTEASWDGGDFRTTVRLGSFSWSYGSYAGKDWNQDANGIVLPSSNLFQEVDPYSEALRAPDNPTNGVSMLGMTPGSPVQFVVEVTPGNGLVQRRYYDAQTHFLTKMDETDYDGHHQQWEYDDYRTVHGLTVAHRIRYERDGTTVTRQTRLISFDRVTSTPNLAPPPSRPLFDLGAAASVQIPADFETDGIFVPVVVDGRQVDFQLDSGSSDIVIDPGVAKELGMTSIGLSSLSFAGDFTEATSRAASLKVGTLSASNVAVSTISFVEDLPNRRVVGLLGTDFIASGALEVNYAKKTLTLYRTVPAELAAQGWSALPLRLDYAVPVVKATFSGLDGQFVMDLGAYYTTLYPHYFDRYPKHIPHGSPDFAEMETVGNRPFGVKSVTMRSLVLGDWVFGGVAVTVPSAQFAQDRDYDGLIGRDTLAQFDMIFDYANDRLWFKPLAPTS